MPQLETATYLSQIFWLLISFFSLWAIMAFLIVPKIEQVLESRRLKIDDYIQKAEELNKKAQISLEKYEKALAKAQADATQRLKDASKDLEQDALKSSAELEASLLCKIQENDEKMSKLRAESLNKLNKTSVLLALSLLNKAGITTATLEKLEALSEKEGRHGANI